MLEARDLTIARDRDRPVLDGVSLRVAPGEVVALEGPSGGGKSTLLWILARLLAPDRGELVLDDAPATEVPVRTWRRRVSLLPQKAALVEGSVRDNLLLPYTLGVRGAGGPDGAPDDTAARAALDGIGLAEIGLDHSAAELSVGQSARVAFLRTLLTGPDYLLLDEPGAALDVESARMVLGLTEAFAGRGGGVVLVRHHDVGVAVDRRLVLAGGALREEAP